MTARLGSWRLPDRDKMMVPRRSVVSGAHKRAFRLALADGSVAADQQSLQTTQQGSGDLQHELGRG